MQLVWVHSAAQSTNLLAAAASRNLPVAAMLGGVAKLVLTLPILPARAIWDPGARLRQQSEFVCTSPAQA